eukprot:Protomagalhaensia_sp_Gyna_25__2232@NODE_2215_length_1218_cov_109_747243_g1836_i0_p3_GENE_NODE_2215_length_1218_cov_109_747243_g1836_i0NODE_2215_length_1218_cov_109_747243_g1836_i0_p3_ORF_typecomplete_len139_score8_42_NODE_2215_length_1218_cov_109_747243_g1836_i0189605
MDKWTKGKENGNFHYMAQTNGALIWSDKQVMHAVFQLMSKSGGLLEFSNTPIRLSEPLKCHKFADRADVDVAQSVATAAEKILQNSFGHFMESALAITVMPTPSYNPEAPFRPKLLGKAGLHHNHPGVWQILTPSKPG